MSMYRQLWLAMIVSMLLALGGSLLASMLSARGYLESQLSIKNTDNASALALSLSQSNPDAVTVELAVAALFDSGHYELIRVVDPLDKIIVERVAESTEIDVPGWFVHMLPIRAAAGIAQISKGWQQFGTITLVSHSRFAYGALWNSVWQMMGALALAGLLGGYLGSTILRRLKAPLQAVIDQANAITERRFVTIDEPKVPELKQLAKAMNATVGRLKTMFNEEATRLDVLRRKVNHDAVTGLSSREYFLAHFREALQGDQFGSSGCLVLVRLLDLNELNARLGRQQTDALLKDIGTELYNSGNGHIGQRAGRVKGAEFAVVCPTFETAQAAAEDIFKKLRDNVLPQWSDQVPDLFHVSAVRYQHDQNMGSVLARADEALAQAANKGPNMWHAIEDGNNKMTFHAEQWRTLLTEAVSGGRLALAFFPIVSGDGANALHSEGVIRLRTDTEGTLISAGDFMPMAAQLNLTAPIDLGVVKLAIEHLQSTQGDIAVNLSAETIANFHFRNELTQLLKAFPEVCKRLLFEVPEYGVFRQFEAFCDLSRNVKQLGCRVGVEYFGQHFADSDKLADLGLDYIKVHPSYIRGLADNPGNQEFLKGLCKIAHSIGITVIALGVQDKNDLPLLTSLGFDGATGPGIS
jgi:diguanylate cyclase (GGDEF)-like protein